MRIPKVDKTRLSKTEQTNISEIEVNIKPEAYLDDLGLFDDPKEYIKFVIRVKFYIRHSLEYTQLMSFLKRKHGMYCCGIHTNLSTYNGFDIAIHHTPFVLEDIVHIVIAKRLKRNESMKMTAIAREIMELHYLGLVGLYPLCDTCHAYAHGDENDLFIPLDNVFGDPTKFFELYEEYATDSIKTKYENIKQLNRGYRIITKAIPDELVKKYIYVKSKETGENDMMSTQKLRDFITDLNK